MSKSERNLLIATIVILIALGIYYFMPDSSSGGGGSPLSLGGGDLAAAQHTFRNYAQILGSSGDIRKNYRQVEGLAHGTSSQGPRELFSTELFTMLREEGFQTPNPEAAKYVAIDNIEDYATVDIHVTLHNSVVRFMQLLSEMERRGMLVKQFTLERGTRETDPATLSITVARVFKQTDESRRFISPGRY